MALLKPFPWLRMVYLDMLSLQSTAQLITNPDQAFQQLFDYDSIFRKLRFFWAELARHHKVNKVIFISGNTDFIWDIN